MDSLSITQVPVWVILLFIITFSVSTISFIIYALSSIKKDEIKKTIPIKKILLFFISYFIIIAFISLTDFFKINTLPPRIIMTTTIPLFLFYNLYVSKKTWFKLVFTNIKLEHLVGIHLFRFV